MKGTDGNIKLEPCVYCREYTILKPVAVGRCVFWLCAYCRGVEVEDD